MEDSIEEQIKQLIQEECNRGAVKSQQHNGILMMELPIMVMPIITKICIQKTLP